MFGVGAQREFVLQLEQLDFARVLADQEQVAVLAELECARGVLELEELLRRLDALILFSVCVQGKSAVSEQAYLLPWAGKDCRCRREPNKRRPLVVPADPRSRGRR